MQARFLAQTTKQAPAPSQRAQMKAAGHAGITRVIMRSSDAASGKTVEISEDHVGIAGPADTINFGAVTSCMTITCLLDDGSKVAAHLVQFGGSPDKTLMALKAAVQGKTVTKVVAMGDGDSWGPTLQTSEQITAASGATSYVKQLEWMQKNRDKFITGALKAFKDNLLGQVGSGSTKFTFVPWSEGTLTLAPKDI